MQGLQVLLLGPPRLELDGQVLTRVLAPKQQALVFYLAASDAPASRIRLANLLWGELEEAAARANLRVALTRLRRWLPGVLDIDGQHVGFHPDASVAVDVKDLAQALLPDVTSARRAEVAEAWRGQPLDGFELPNCEPFEQWMARLRRRATEQAIALRRMLLGECEAQGQLAQGVRHARALLEIDDADEPAHMALMRMLAAGGQRTAALAQYETCRAALAERLGARPAPECFELYRRIHASPVPSRPVSCTAGAMAMREGGAQASAVREPDRAQTRVRARDAPDLVGRDGELALLAERLLDPACRVLTVVGPGGVGKTSLALAVAARLEDHFRRGVLWLNGRDEAAHAGEAEALAQRVLDRTGTDRHAAGALLLVLDNVETIAEARSLLSLLAARAPGVTVLATGRARLRGGREWLLELAGLSRARAGADEPASSAAARLLTQCVRQAWPEFDAQAHAAPIEELCEWVGGLPLALELAAHQAHLAGLPAIVARLKSGDDLEDTLGSMPQHHHSVAAVIDESWLRLPQPAREAAVRLCVLPADFDTELAQAVGVQAGELQTLRDHSWLSRVGGDRLAFHPLQLDYLRRQQAARSIAAGLRDMLVQRFLQRLPSVEPFGDIDYLTPDSRAFAESASFSAALVADIARHLAERGDPAECVEWVNRTMAVLIHMDRLGEAAALAALAAGRHDLPVWRTAGWRLREAEIRNGLGASLDALHAYNAGFQALGLGLFDLRGGLRAAWLGPALRVWTLHKEPSAVHERRALTGLVTRGLIMMGVMLSFSPEPAAMIRANLLVHLLARRGRSAAPRNALAIASAWGAIHFGYPALARLLTPPFGRAAPGGDPRLELFARHGHCALRLALGDWMGLMPSIDDIAERWNRWHAGRYEMEARSLAAKLAFYTGHLGDAYERFTVLSELSLRRPGDAWRAWGPLGQIETALCLGNLDEEDLRRIFEQAVRVMVEMENVDAAYTLRRHGLAARLHWRCGEWPAARAAVLAGVAAARRIPRIGFWAHEGFSGLGEVLLALRARDRHAGAPIGDWDRAWSAMQAPLKAHLRHFPPAAAMFYRLRAQRAAQDGDAKRALHDLGRANDRASRQGMRAELARNAQVMSELDPSPAAALRVRLLLADIGAASPP